MKKVIFILFLFVSVFLISNSLFGTSLAYSYDIDNTVLFYKDDFSELEEDMKLYLTYIDNYVIPNSSFFYSDELRNNYDFLVNFALDYVLNNIEYYNESIISGDNCNYINKYGIENFTYNYVDVEVVYEIIDKYFGVRDFSIINDNVCIKDNYLSLSDYTFSDFEFNIIDVIVSGDEDNISVHVLYDNGDNYLYTFYNDNNVLKLKNVEVI